VINGSKDVIIYTVNSFILQQNLANAQLILYPDSNHGSQYQYPALFVAPVGMSIWPRSRAANTRPITPHGPARSIHHLSAGEQALAR